MYRGTKTGVYLGHDFKVKVRLQPYKINFAVILFFKDL
jgi:hypothetical protein